MSIGVILPTTIGPKSYGLPEVTRENWSDERCAFIGSINMHDPDNLFIVTHDAVVLAKNPRYTWMSERLHFYVTAWVNVEIEVVD